MSITPPTGILDITDAIVRVSKLEFRGATGFDTILNNVARNTALLVDQNVEYTTDKAWGLKLPNAWVSEFDAYWASGASGNIDFNIYNNTSSGTNGYVISMDDTTITVTYDGGSALKTVSLGSTLKNDTWRKIHILFERDMISLALDGTPVLYFKDTLLRPRVYDEESGYVITSGLSADRKVKNLRIMNGDKWMTDNTSNIAFVHGNVGIGTTQAAYTLDVKGDIRATGNLLIEGLTTTVDTQNLSIEDAIVEIGRGNDGGTSGKDVGFLFTRNNGADTTNSNVALIYDESTDRLTLGYSDGSPTASTLAINTSKSLDVVIPSGNLGIGTASPALDLHVMGGIITQNNGAITPQIQFKSGANNTNGWLVRANISDTFAGDFTIDRQDNSVTPSKFVIKNGGNVGIGTTNPGQALHIYRSGANNAVIKAEAAGTQEAEIQLYHTGDAAAWSMYMPANSDSLRFYRNGDKMTLTSGGNVGIGTTSPGQKLEVGHYGGALSSDFGAIRITNHATNLHATSLAHFDISLGDINSGTGSGNRKLIFNSKTTTTDSGTDILCLDGLNNNVGIGTTSPGNSRVAIYNNETDANSTSSLGLELAAPWIRIGDGIGGRTMTNGSGIKFHDSGVAHYSVGQKDGKFRIASTGIQGNELFPSGYTEGVVITTTGNVGIATDSPAYTLDVSGTLHAGNSYFDTVYIGGSTSRGLRSVSGQFGTVQTTGEGAGNWEGYSIDGRYVFMSADNNSCGIYNDLDNKWILYAYRNSYVRLYYAGAEKLATNSGGITVTGSITGSMSTSLSPGSYLTGTAYNGSTARTFDVDATDAATASKVVARDANGSFSANVVTATSVSGNGSGLTSLNASNISSGTLGTAHIPNLDAGKITSGTLTRPINASTGVFTHVSLGTNKYPTLGGNWLTIFSPSFHGNLGPNHPDPDGGILFTNTSSGSTFPWGYYMGVVKDVASTNGTTQRFDIGKSSDLNSQDSTGGSDSLTPYLTIDNGDVGIGTTSPAYKLDVHGTSNVGVLTTTSVSGNGSGLTSLNADNINSGTLGRPISTTTGTFSGVVTCNDVLKLEAGSTTGDTSVESTHKTNTYIRFGAAGSSNDWAYLRQIGGDNLIKLALDFHDDNEARFEIRKVNSSGNSGSSEVATTVFSVDNGAVTATSFSGSGSSLTSLNADNLSSGTVPSARLSLAASDIPDLSASKITSGTLGRPISTTTGTFSGLLTASGGVRSYKDGVVAEFQPATSGEYTLINFHSKVNSGSDRGFILVQDESATSPGAGSEDLRMAFIMILDRLLVTRMNFGFRVVVVSCIMWVVGTANLIQS